MIWKSIIAIALAYVLGLIVFVETLPAPGVLPAHADGIVALTGEERRMNAAVELLERGMAKRLLITGVHKEITKDELKRMTHGGPRFDCCADMGYEAEDTQGNADEAAEWVRAHGYKSLIVVTTNYHMPRSLAEFAADMPGVKLEAYAVAPGQIDFAHWWHNLHALRVLNAEFVKYVASVILVHVFPPRHRLSLDRSGSGGKAHASLIPAAS